jgi:hypothetical protein
MPWVPTSDSLAALKYLDPTNSGFPMKIRGAYARVKLDRHLLGTGRWGWWEGAYINNDQWRKDNMTKSPKVSSTPDFKVEEVLRLTKIVFENDLCPTSVRAYALESSSSESSQGVAILKTMRRLTNARSTRQTIPDRRRISSNYSAATQHSSISKTRTPR